jgi:hypothetical protein
MRDRFFIYAYLDPFKELTKPLQVTAGSKEICFGYEPFYIGKGTGSGYRQHQHLKEFLDKREINRYKVEKLVEIESNMAKAAAKGDISKPWNWEEFQKEWIIIIDTFENSHALVNFELELINKIGTRFDNSGPLTNKIKRQSKFDYISKTGNGQLM